MKEITFKFRDSWSDGRWITRHCTMESVDECIHMYGLDEPSVEYEIIEVKEV